MDEFVVTVNSKKRNVRFLGNSLITVESQEFQHELYHLSGDTYLLKLENKIYEIFITQIDEEKFIISIAGRNIHTIVRTSLKEKAVNLIEQNFPIQNTLEVKAPMPGMIIKIIKKPGDEVLKGDSILILEAMKMENDLKAHISGKIIFINVKEGMAVEKGYSLFTIG
ncbi:MAG: hypothetical protein P4L35_14410 [Ignavibacteriaceae bacterium]|nr:hypothetical protein [Ignavibacteriaceae bacterium]